MTAPINHTDTTTKYPRKLTLDDITPYVEKNVPYIPEPEDSDASYVLTVPASGEPEWEDAE